MENEFKKPLAVSLAILYGSITVFSVVYYLLSRDVASRVQSIVDARNAIQNNATAVEVLANFKELSNEIDKYEASIGEFLPPEDQIIDFPGWLEENAHQKDLGYSFMFQDGKKPSTEDAPGSVPFTIAVTGVHENLYAFFRDVTERSPKFLVVFSGWDAVIQGNGDYRVQTGGRVYFQ